MQDGLFDTLQKVKTAEAALHCDRQMFGIGEMRVKYMDLQERKMPGTAQFPVSYQRHMAEYATYETLHWHTCHELIHIKEGVLRLQVEETIYVLRAGDSLLIAAGSIHGISTGSRERRQGMEDDRKENGQDPAAELPEMIVYESVRFDFLQLMKDQASAMPLLHDFFVQKKVFDPYLPKDTKAAQSVKQLCECLAEKRFGVVLEAKGYFCLLFARMMQEECYTDVLPTLSNTNQAASYQRVLFYIEQHYAERLTLSQLAEVAGMNPKYFCRYFKGISGRTPIDYLNDYRIACSCPMLAAGEISIRQVAISCGFNDESYFIKIFHKYKGMTPKKYQSLSRERRNLL